MAAHGGIFGFLTDGVSCPGVVTDESMRGRFSNCELRAGELTLAEDCDEEADRPTFALGSLPAADSLRL